MNEYAFFWLFCIALGIIIGRIIERGGRDA